MEKKHTQKAARQRDALPQQTPAKDGAELAPATALTKRGDRMQIFKKDGGQLAISEAGCTRVTQTFLGSNAQAGQENTRLDNIRLVQVTCALPHSKGGCEDPLLLNIALDGVAALAPRDGMEVMLCSQLVALHSQSMEFMRHAVLDDLRTLGVDSNVNRVAKTLRMFATMAECLRTYRGGGQQKVTVEHVTVQAGGQAVVGTVNRGAGVGMHNKTANEPHAKRRGRLKNASPQCPPTRSLATLRAQPSLPSRRTQTAQSTLYRLQLAVRPRLVLSLSWAQPQPIRVIRQRNRPHRASSFSRGRSTLCPDMLGPGSDQCIRSVCDHGRNELHAHTAKHKRTNLLELRNCQLTRLEKP